MLKESHILSKERKTIAMDKHTIVTSPCYSASYFKLHAAAYQGKAANFNQKNSGKLSYAKQVALWVTRTSI
jgi:hypothetical protein